MDVTRPVDYRLSGDGHLNARAHERIAGIPADRIAATP